MKRTILAAAFILAATGALAGPRTRPARPATQPAKTAKLDLDATVKLLTKRVGGKWQKGAHNAFLQTKRVVRGYIYAATDKVLVRYIVYPLELFEGRPPVLSTLRMCGNAEILGVSPACVVTVFSTAPADKVAPYSKGVTKALGLKPPKVTRRAMQAADVMKKNVASFTLTLRYHGPQDKPHYRLLLTAVPIERKERPFEMIRFLDARQAGKIIDHLAEEGFLAGAANIESKKIAYPKGPAYTMTVTGHGVLYQNLGWDLKTLHRLGALRKVLTSKAGKAMDKVLKPLEPQRKKWQKAAGPAKKKGT